MDFDLAEFRDMKMQLALPKSEMKAGSSEADETKKGEA